MLKPIRALQILLVLFVSLFLILGVQYFYYEGFTAHAAAATPQEQVLSLTPSPSPSIRVYFSPHGGCTQAIVAAIYTAQSSILVQAYSFTSAPIADALVKAHRRGVDVRVILDNSQRTEHYSSATFLVNSGIPVWIDGAHGIAHNKVMVIDGAMVVTGSFNFTKAAEESNAENLLLITSAGLASQYAANCRVHLAHSQPCRSR